MDDARKLAARLLCFGFDGYEVNDHAREMLDMGAGSCIIFARNIRDPAQVAKLCADLKRYAAPRPLIVMVDQEGGRVARLREPHYTEVPAAGRIGEAPDGVRAAAASGYIFGKELKAVGVDMDLAPVVDVNTNPKNRVIGDRSYGTTPSEVSAMGAAFITSIQQQGVAACAKHWRGPEGCHTFT